MNEKAKLTLETALEHFPEECEAIAEDDMINFWLCHSLSIGWCMLVAAALRWLAGKEVSEAIWLDGLEDWPDDPLRFFLEEVRAQRKKEI